MTTEEFREADLAEAEKIAKRIRGYWLNKHYYGLRVDIIDTGDGYVVRSNLDERGYPPRV